MFYPLNDFRRIYGVRIYSKFKRWKKSIFKNYEVDMYNSIFFNENFILQ